ncbi:MAG: pseudouridine synthase [Lysobacterales bacterium]
MNRPPVRDGVSASRLQLPAGAWRTLLDGLAAHFPAISRERWLDRIARGRVIDAQGVTLTATTPYRAGAEICYWREVSDEPRIAAEESVLHVDAHLVVADKPHGLPVMPAGEFVTETLLARLVRRLGSPHLVPLHRIDRDTAGLVLFSAHPESRARYHALFRERRIDKRYEALAPPLPAMEFPHVRRRRIERGEPFFRMREMEGEPNSETHIDVIDRGDTCWRYMLQPVTGKKHQLRVHMAALGAPILGDPLYPLLRQAGGSPLQLLAKSLAFVDPIDGVERHFESRFKLLDESGARRLRALVDIDHGTGEA